MHAAGEAQGSRASRVFVNARPPTHLELSYHFANAYMSSTNTSERAHIPKNEGLKGRGGGRLKHYNVDGDVPMCLKKTERKKQRRQQQQ